MRLCDTCVRQTDDTYKLCQRRVVIYMCQADRRCIQVVSLQVVTCVRQTDDTYKLCHHR